MTLPHESKILKGWLICNTKYLGPFHIINENKQGKILSIYASKTEVFTWRTAKAYFIPSRPPCLTSHCSCVSNLSSTSTVLWTPVSFMCFNTTPNVWAQVSRTGATTYKWERKKTPICKKLILLNLKFDWAKPPLGDTYLIRNKVSKSV